MSALPLSHGGYPLSRRRPAEVYVTRIGRWLREPVKARGDDWDWAAFSRSFGRWTGGYLDPGRDDPPTWKRGQGPAAGEPTNTPRWVVLLAVCFVIGVATGFITLVFLGTG